MSYILYSKNYIVLAITGDKKMNWVQKVAWFDLITLAIIILASNGVVIWMAIKRGYPVCLSGYGFLGFGFLHLLGLAFFRKKGQSVQVDYDERDIEIIKKSLSVGDNVTIGFFILGVGLLLYHYHVIKKKKMEEYAELYGFLLIGILVHLILDAFFIEGSWLI